MASTLPCPPSTPNTSSSPDPSTLISRLDALLSQYLTLLDTYTTLRTQLSSQFSSGFLSLAHANRNATATLGAGRRYGEEGYDERMKASRAVRIEELKSRLRLEDATEQDEADDEEEKDGNDIDEKALATHPGRLNDVTAENEQDSTPETEKGRALPNADTADEISHISFSTPGLTSPSTDPLRWYGLLIPPTLRQCQSTFTTSITNTIPSLLTITSQMSALEGLIWDARAELGLLDEYDCPGKASKDAEEAVKERAEQTSKTVEREKETESSSKKGLGNLVSRSRPSEPRSRILKMGD